MVVVVQEGDPAEFRSDDRVCLLSQHTLKSGRF
jgi:hypothetical protein